MFNLNFYFMKNLCFSRPSPDGDTFVQTLGIFVETPRSDGSYSLDPIKDPYDGLLAQSFSLDAQLQAGVPLLKVGPMSSGGIGAVDINNASASEFMNNLRSQNNE